MNFNVFVSDWIEGCNKIPSDFLAYHNYLCGILRYHISFHFRCTSVLREEIQIQSNWSSINPRYVVIELFKLYRVSLIIFQELSILLYSNEKPLVVLLGIPYLFSAFASPILGFMIDKTGRNVTFITLACVLTLASHAMFAFTLSQACAYLAIGLLGLGYSLLAASLWPVIALVIPLHRQGTAFGTNPYFTTLHSFEFYINS